MPTTSHVLLRIVTSCKNATCVHNLDKALHELSKKINL